MLQEELRYRYFEWLYKLVCGDRNYNSLSYRKLLSFLYDTRFTYIHGMDENRAQDGIDFRYRFGYENDYSDGIIERYLDITHCNVLEMMVALAFKAEEQIMDDYIYGDRTGQWFWNMIVSLGLGAMHDNNFDEGYTRRIIYRFLDREYEPNGKGGLFTINHCMYDLRTMEIWSQFMWYLDEVIDSDKY